MAKLIQTLATGLQLGSVYALVALGYTMVYGIIKLINFAHGDLIMVGGYTLLYTIPMIASMGLSPWIAVVFAVVVCVMIGVLTELLAYRPVRRRGTGMTALITAMAMSLILQNLAQYLLYMTHTMYGATVKSIFPQGSISITLGHQKLSLSLATLCTIGISCGIMIALQFMVRRTALGRAMRAVSEDKEASSLMGIGVNRIILVTFVIGSALAGIASAMWFSIYPSTSPGIGSALGLFAFVSAVLGGIGSIPGAVVGGFVIGIVYSFTTSYISSGMSDAVVFLMLIMVLLFMPAGLLGKEMKEKV